RCSRQSDCGKIQSTSACKCAKTNKNKKIQRQFKVVIDGFSEIDDAVWSVLFRYGHSCLMQMSPSGARLLRILLFDNEHRKGRPWRAILAPKVTWTLVGRQDLALTAVG